MDIEVATKPSPSRDDVLRRMLKTPPTPHAADGAGSGKIGKGRPKSEKPEREKPQKADKD